MTFEWIPVSPDTVPDKTKEATDIIYFITILHEDNITREILVSNWGPVDPACLEIFKNDPFLKDYIFDDWAFGDLWSDGINTVDRAIAWSYMPDPYEEVTKPEDPWYYTLGTRIAMRDMNGEWHNGVVCSGYRFKDGIVAMKFDDGLGKMWRGEEGENIWFRKLEDEG